ncbi:MAG: primosomal protein N' [Dolichospermum sp. DEX189]|jgi:primosomal protein N' (replication factor Y)|uniref:Replication restart protein PriA n=1 Tax=Aphanizomenon flos-aquae FACHB-1040 TaxID=2692887 RepID=A0ABR8BWN5_APHFL|nr:primosomal protein N' [Aphanizomenon flos-aquae]MBD2279102.1 primosomal protein N' [Aphanizomenon flos-aquae FACHB-1040]MBO1071432.1 primosomal protein N' [Dolichospermum sp. DEX189]
MYSISVNSSVITVSEPGGLYQSQTKLSQWVEVLVDCPGCSDLFTYKIPEQLEIKPGDILSVPFGATQVGAIAIRLLTQPNLDIPLEKIREVEDVVSEGFFPAGYWILLNRVAAYYYTPLIQVIRVALPPGLLGRSQRRLRLTPLGRENLSIYISPTAQQVITLLQKTPTADYSYHYIQQKVKAAYRGIRELIRLGLAENYLEPPRLTQPKLQKAVTLLDNHDDDLTTRQKEIVEVLRRQGGEMWQSELLQLCATSTSTLKALVDKGYIVIEDREILRQEQGPTVAGDWAKSLTPAQNNALETINSLTGFTQVLLHGVTGSGKTEVYLQAISPLLAQGKSALVLVPEIGLTPQLTDRFRARFGNKVHVYHSALSDGERYDTWRQMLTGEPQIIIGTRSAIFAPLPNLGLIILDEEHDSSFKQDSPIPTYHARTVAQWRAELEHCPLILGSATPSLESWVSRNHQYLSLPERINSRPLPPVEIVDMRQELKEGNRSIFSRKLQNALQQLEARQQQGILFIHRRGHSTFVSCRSCGYVLECPHCDVSLAYHHVEAGAPELLRCHYCNYGRLHPPHCPECSSPYLKFFGSGTQRVAQELTKQFPNLKIIRFDSDTTTKKGSHRELLTRFANGEAHLLVGTQMLTKGLDLPQVTLVGVVAADGLLHLSDYRANERTFQTLTQVAGRAGRGDDPGRVIVQTYTPEHPIIEAVQKHDYQSFCDAELAQRQALNYPPYGRLILLRLSSLDPIQVQNTAQIIATFLNDKEGFEILGPAPASILRVANRYRWQILLKFAPDALPNLPDWPEVRSLIHSSVSLTIDVDPINIM